MTIALNHEDAKNAKKRFKLYNRVKIPFAISAFAVNGFAFEINKKLDSKFKMLVRKGI